MLIVVGSATAAPGRRDELVTAAREVAAATRKDRGCLAYSFAADVEDEDRILSIEGKDPPAPRHSHARSGPLQTGRNRAW